MRAAAPAIAEAGLFKSDGRGLTGFTLIVTAAMAPEPSYGPSTQAADEVTIGARPGR